MIFDFSFGESTGHVTITDGSTEVTDWAFSGRDEVKSVTIPDSVTSIGLFAFANNDLAEVTLPNQFRKEPLTFANDSDVKLIYAEPEINDSGNDRHGNLYELPETTITVNGTRGKDKLRGYKSNDSIIGLANNDRLNGKKGDDILIGGKGIDTLNGQKGDDYLFGGQGADILVGGRGADVFRASKGVDTIRDFQPKEGDRIAINANDEISFGIFNTFEGLSGAVLTSFSNEFTLYLTAVNVVDIMDAGEEIFIRISE